MIIHVLFRLEVKLDFLKTAGQSLLISTVIVGSLNLLQMKSEGSKLGYGAKVSLKIDDLYMGDLKKLTYGRYDDENKRDEWVYRSAHDRRNENFQLGLVYREGRNYKGSPKKLLGKFNRLKNAVLTPQGESFEQMTAIGSFEFMKFALETKSIRKECLVFTSDTIAKHTYLRGYYCAADQQTVSVTRLACILGTIESQYLPVAVGIPQKECEHAST